MPAGLPYFAWIDPTETVFGPEHLRWDESVFSFSLTQSEGDPASLTVVVRRPRNSSGNPIGLLGPGRKIWCWFALDCDGTNLIKFRGRLVGVPTSLFEDLVTLEFVARPLDLVAQKAALADSLRVLPFYDPVVIDPSRATDPEVVLEGYSAIWHYDRETLTLTVSDEITGEDGLLNFDGTTSGGTVLWDGLSLNLSTGPLARVDVNASYTWTQTATGSGIDLTKYITENWPNETPQVGIITSFTMDATSWPKPGTGLGNGWVVAQSQAFDVYSKQTRTDTESDQTVVNWWDGSSVRIQNSSSDTVLTSAVPGSIGFPAILTHSDSSFGYTNTGDFNMGYQSTEVTSYSGSMTQVSSILPLNFVNVTLVAGFSAARPCTETVSFSLYADVQPILTDPDDGEALTLDNITSVNLSDPLDGVIPIGDTRRRSYIATARGNQSLEHLIALARATLLKRARVVEIAFVPKLERMPEVTLRKNVFLVEPRVGEATGKIISYTVALDGSDGAIKCEIKIGCAIGRGGSQVLTAGTPTYCTVDYVGADYQQFNDRLVAWTPTDTSIGYQPPNANPDDDGIDFLSTMRAEDVIDIPLVVTNPPAFQRAQVLAATPDYSLVFSQTPPTSAEDAQKQWEDSQQALLQARAKGVSDVLQKYPTSATFKLKSMTRSFASPYPIQMTDLKIPTGYNLEAT